MCGVFGVYRPRYIDAEGLIFANRQRGNQGIGLMYFTNNSKVIKRGHTVEQVLDVDLLSDSYLLLGHMVAPTSRTSNIHPIEYGEWTLAHNGILLDYKKYTSYNDIHETLDSAYLLSAIAKGTLEKTTNNIAQGINLFEGQQTCWLVNGNDVYLWRVMSSLKQGKLDDRFAFSSVIYKTLKDRVTQNTLYKLTDNGLKEVIRLQPTNSYV